MESSGSKKGSKLEDEMKKETEAVERSGRESRAEESREQEPTEDAAASGHRISGSGSSADTHSYTDRGEEGGASHPKPKDDEERSERTK